MKREVTEIKEVCQYVGIIFLACDFFEPIHLSFQRELHLSPKPLSNGLYPPPRFPRFRGTETSGEKKETALQSYICPTCPSPAGGSLTHSQALALSKRVRDVTALRCSEPLRSKVGGPSEVSPDYLCGVNRLAKGDVGSSSDILTALQWDLKWLGL